MRLVGQAGTEEDGNCRSETERLKENNLIHTERCETKLPVGELQVSFFSKCWRVQVKCKRRRHGGGCDIKQTLQSETDSRVLETRNLTPKRFLLNRSEASNRNLGRRQISNLIENHGSQRRRERERRVGRR